MTKKNLKQTLLLIVFAALMLWIVFNYKLFIDLVVFLINLLLPLIVGIAIAFIINVPMKLIERKIFKIEKRKHKKIIRAISLTLSIIIILGIVILLTFLVVPEFIEAIINIGKSIPNTSEWINDLINKTSELYPNIEKYVSDADIKNLISTSINSAGSVMSIVVVFLKNLITRIITFFIGFILAIYILADKEKLCRQTKKLLIAFLPEKTTNEIIKIVKLTNTTFTNFLTGQCLDAALMGLLIFIIMSIVNIPYALILGVLFAVTALIPYIGAFITLVIGIILIAVTNPIQAVWYVIIFFVVQQIDENITYPRIVGGSVGIPALWALVAVLIGGSIFGFLGMIISIPIFSILYTLLRDYANKKIENKNKN